MRRKATVVARAVSIVAGMLCFSSLASADITGTVLGIVSDPTGAAVPGASVTLRNPTTGFTRQTTSSASGSYEFPLIPIGSDYVVEVQKQGFEKATQTGITLLVNQKFRADFTLVVGALSQTVEVTAATTQVETTSTQVGDVIENSKMTNLPLNGRSYVDLLGLQAGVVPMNSGVQSSDRPVSGNGNSGNLSVNGQREANNSFLVNGGDVEEGRNNGTSIVPVLDSIQEFRLITNSFDAEYGRFSGAIVNVVTKSGNNGLHGTLFEFVRNEKLDSRNFFDLNQVNSATGQDIPNSAIGVFRRNQFGWAIGGPILKNRLFFFTDYQGTRENRGLSTGNIPVPSSSERDGNFSDTTTTGFNPLTGTVQGDDLPGHFAQVLSGRLGYPVTAGEPYWAPGCTSNTQCVFPNETIPATAWDPVAAATLKFIPTEVGTSGGQPFFSTSAQKQTTNDDKFGIRIDLNNQHAGNLLFYYHYDNSSVLNPYPAANVPGFPALTPARAQQFNLNDTKTFNPTTVNELVLNYTRSAAVYREPKGGLGDITSFGFTQGGLGINPVYAPLEGMPWLNLGLLGVTIGLPDGTTGQYNNTYQASDHLSRVSGKHTMKFGGEYRYLQINERNTYAQNGFFSFNGAETGNDFADYLIGAVPPGNMIQSSRQFLDSRTKYAAAFGQDTFKFKQNLTLNYGLRWEASEPFYDTQGKIEAFVPGEQSKRFPGSPTGWLVPGDPGIPNTLSPTRWNNFAPRVGFAYSPGSTDGPLAKIFGGPGKTSIRGAFGMYYTAIEDLTLFVEVGDSPYGLFFVGPSPVYLNEPYKTRTEGTDVGQRFPFTIPPPGAAVNTTFNWGQVQPLSGAPGFKTDNVLPYAEHINFSVERQIKNSLLLTVAYVGTRGHHLIAQSSFNPGIAATCLNTPGCGPFGEDSIWPLPNGQNQNGTRIYSVTSGRFLNQGILDFANNTYEETLANSNYNSLQVSLEKRVGAVRLLAAYTYSKSLDDSSAFSDQINPFDARLSKSLSTFDLTHNFVTSYSYELPFGRLAHATSGALGKLLGGWTISGITRFTTGLPIGMGEGDDQSLCGCGVDTPNWNGQYPQFSNPRASADHQYFTTTPFSQETLGAFGTANRRFFHGPGLNNWDMSLHKMTQITEKTNLEIRAEFFNLFNHAQFGNPSGSITSSTFGLVTGANDPRIGQVAMKFYF